MANGASPYTYLSYVPVGPMVVTALVVRSDGAFIPCVTTNNDYQAFLAWVKAGNTAPAGWTGPTS